MKAAVDETADYDELYRTHQRAMLRVYTNESTAAEQSHLRFCADCAERYDGFIEDLATIGGVLDAPRTIAEKRRMSPAWRTAWMPVAIAAAILLTIFLDVTWLHRSSPVQLASDASNVSAFATELSDALFARTDPNLALQLTVDTPYVDAALNAVSRVHRMSSFGARAMMNFPP